MLMSSAAGLLYEGTIVSLLTIKFAEVKS
jgi:hypothetical protein